MPSGAGKGREAQATPTPSQGLSEGRGNLGARPLGVGWEVVEPVAKGLEASHATIEGRIDLPSLGLASHLGREALADDVQVVLGITLGNLPVVGIGVRVSHPPLLLAEVGDLLPSRPMELILALGETRVPDGLRVVRGLNPRHKVEKGGHLGFISPSLTRDKGEDDDGLGDGFVHWFIWCVYHYAHPLGNSKHYFGDTTDCIGR